MANNTKYNTQQTNTQPKTTNNSLTNTSNIGQQNTKIPNSSTTNNNNYNNYNNNNKNNKSKNTSNTSTASNLINSNSSNSSNNSNNSNAKLRKILNSPNTETLSNSDLNTILQTNKNTLSNSDKKKYNNIVAKQTQFINENISNNKSNTNANSNLNTSSNSNANRNSNINSNTSSNLNANSNSNTNSNLNAKRNSNANTIISNSNVNSNTNTTTKTSPSKSIWYIIVNIIILVIVLLIVYYLGNYLIKKYLFTSANMPYLLNTTKNAKHALVISQDPSSINYVPIKKSDGQDGIQFTYGFWFLLDNVDYKKGEWKHVFHKGNSSSYPNRAPGVWFHPDKNSIRVYMNTVENILEYADIDNLPLRKWVYINIILNNKNLDLYVNGYLKIRKELSSIPKQNDDDFWVNMYGGFEGYLSNIRYYSYAIDFNTIYSTIKEGPSTNNCIDTGELPPYLDDNWWFEYNG